MMFRSSLILFLLTGCGSPEVQTTSITLPIMDLSKSSIEFLNVSYGEEASKNLIIENVGELPMGLHEILLEDDEAGNFSISYDPDAIQCQGDFESDIIDLESREANIGDTDFILNPNCKISVSIQYAPVVSGDVYAAIEIESFIEDTEAYEDKTPRFYRDPTSFKQSVIVKGTSDQGVGNIFVTPRIVDFGHFWTGESSTKQIFLGNTGSGPLEIETPYTTDCDDAFSLDTALLEGNQNLQGGDQTLFEVNFEPLDLETAYCTVVIPSNDPETSDIEVTLKGNAGVDPTNKPPEVSLIHPSPGHVHSTNAPLEIDVSLFDFNQPADTLICKVKSMILAGPNYTCTADPETGIAHVEIPTEDLQIGIDTLLITVTDQSELQSSTSTTIIYGATHPESDDDGDGFGDGMYDIFVDCDDNDPFIYPYAAEIPDGKDNDCDGGIDEKTTVTDDDGDSLSELDGDCNDNDKDTYPGAPEKPDLRDNDCDGIIDENTSLSDDDGDGFSELDNDCNDRNKDINPAAIEYCDNIDNNCNALRDEQEPDGCVEIDSKPQIVGKIQMAERAIGSGESTTMTVFVYDAEGDEISFLWEEDPNMYTLDHVAISNPTARTITWTAPDLPSTLDGQLFSVYVIVTDENGNQDWVFDEIAVYANPVAEELVFEEVTGGCGSSTAAALMLPLLGLSYIRRRKTQITRK